MTCLRKRIISAALPLMLIFSTHTATAQDEDGHPEIRDRGNLVLRWSNAVVHSAGKSPHGAPMLARIFAIVHTCIYDAWAAYDSVAIGTRLGGQLRRPAGERSVKNKQEAVSYAAYRAASALLPADRGFFDTLMVELGYDPHRATTNPTSPAGIGHIACGAVLDYRKTDGSNQNGELGGDPYSDWSGYSPVNEPMDIDAPFDPSAVRDPNRWQPLTYRYEGRQVTQEYLGAHWGQVRPFALADGLPITSSRPFLNPSPEYVEQARDLVDISAKLNDTQKMVAEFWRLNPGTVQPPGKWLEFGQYVSRRDSHGLDADAKLFFALSNALMDAGIASWRGKRNFDYVRPITAIRWLFHDRTITAWGGPGQGSKEIKGARWLPYQPTSAPSPPFAEFPSGHSTFSAAASEVLKSFTGSDHFGGSVVFRAGSSDTEPGVTPHQDIHLSWPTFSAAAAQAGISRRYGGIHFEHADLAGRQLGREVGARCWKKALAYFSGRIHAQVYHRT